MKTGEVTRRFVRGSGRHRVILMLIATSLSTSCSSKPDAPVPQPEMAVRSSGSVNNAGVVPPHDCPPFTSFPEPAMVNDKGDHRVILSWNPSASADADHADAIGYCIYRGTKPADRSMVRVNRKPFRGTSCTDSAVQNAATYYYKVRAVSAQGNASKASNLALAHIPTRKPSVSTTVPPPSCQAADAVQ